MEPFGISMEIRCGSVTMPGEGITVAISRVSCLPFPKAKIYVDSALVISAVALSYLFFGRWLWNVVGVATLFAMINDICGACSKGNQSAYGVVQPPCVLSSGVQAVCLWTRQVHKAWPGLTGRILPRVVI